MDWEEFQDWLGCQMEVIAAPLEKSKWTLDDIYMSHGDRLRHVAMSNDEHAAFVEWRASQKEQRRFSSCSFLLKPLIATLICSLIFNIALP
jgi:hypothetical protein